MRLYWDIETFCETAIEDGAYRYSENAEILLFTWAVDDGEVHYWDVTLNPNPPLAFLEAIDKADEYWAHNGNGFDRPVVRKVMPELYARMTEHKHRDSMLKALCHGLPGSLAKLCDIFKLDSDQAKHKRGRQLIQHFCKPQSENRKIRRHTQETHPTEWLEFIEYAKSDIRAMRQFISKSPSWNYPNNVFELALSQLDFKANSKGLLVDIELAKEAVITVGIAQAKLARGVNKATNGEVSSGTQRDKLLRHILQAYGVSLPNLRGDTIRRRIDDESLPEGVRTLLALRLEAATSSVSKYRRLIRSASSDGYLRGVIQFSGAGRTGRDAGRLFQPQNLMRPTLDTSVVEKGIEALKAECLDLVADNVIETCANAMRGVIIAPPGKKLVIADLSNIEGRVLAWLAGEEWKLQAFRDYDAGKGEDLYKIGYSSTFRVPPSEVTKSQRQIGKVIELFLGFEGGVGAFLTGAATYGIELDDLNAEIPGDIWRKAEEFYEWHCQTMKRQTFGLKPETFIMCDSIKRLWRCTNARITSWWPELKAAVITAIENPGAELTCRKVKILCRSNWLRIVLPSGRSLSYPAPRVNDEGGISYMGLSQYSRKWERIKTYGGKLAENITQAVARDVFKSSYPAITEAGYEIKLPIHDEILSYAPDGELYSAKHMSHMMVATSPPWAAGLPLAAAGFEAYRYKKG